METDSSLDFTNLFDDCDEQIMESSDARDVPSPDDLSSGMWRS